MVNARRKRFVPLPISIGGKMLFFFKQITSNRYHKEDIEELFKESLSWEGLEGKKHARICYRMEIGGYQNENTWDEVSELVIDKMILLESTLAPYIKKLKG